MKQRLFWILVCVCVGAGTVRAAMNLANLSDADRKQVNEWMSQRAEVMVGAHKLEGEVSQAWADESYSTPEIQALRARYRELQQELLRTQRELQKSVLEVPAVQAKVRQLEAAKKQEQELAQKIAEKTGK
jgi:hypothetical protein